MYNFNELIATELNKEELWVKELEKQRQWAKEESLMVSSDICLRQGFNPVQDPNRANPKKVIKVFQPVFPSVRLDLKQFKNERDAYIDTYRFTELADKTPSIKQVFENRTTFRLQAQELWKEILEKSDSKHPLTKTWIGQANSWFLREKKGSIKGQYNHDWRKTEAFPFNWYDILLDAKNLIPITLNIPEKGTQQQDKTASLITLQNSQVPAWNTQDGNIEINADTKIKTIHLNVLVVEFIRNWYYDAMLTRDDWYIPDVEAGFYSTGTLKDNDGEFPLLPTHIVIAGKTAIDAFLAKEDEKLLQTGNKNLSLDSFLLSSDAETVSMERLDNSMTRLSSNTPYILGYISNLMPKYPPLSGFMNE